MAMDNMDEPHIKRKRAILDKHDQIPKLFGPEPLTKYIAVLAVAGQLSCAYMFGTVLADWHWTRFVASYVIGATFTQIFGVIIHEAAHGLCFESPLANRLLGLFVNCGLPVPIAASFRRYHLEHHAYQGVRDKDPDLPLDFEMRFVKGNPISKLVFLFFYPLMYVVRGMAMKKAPSFWEYVNLAVVIVSDYLVYQICGPMGLYYLCLSLWLGYGIHPAAAHFIQEHYTFEDGQETYSYYGPLNKIFMNIGYHYEHHDFTKIPWTKLPTLKAMAPEFYDTLVSHSSWTMVLVNFVFDKSIGPQSRVGRTYEDHKKARQMGPKMEK